MSIEYIEGFYSEENDNTRNFRWMQPQASIQISPSIDKILVFYVGNPHKRNEKITIVGEKSISIELETGWHKVSIPLSFIMLKDTKVITFFCKAYLSIPGEERILSLMISDIKIESSNIDTKDIIILSGYYDEEFDGIRRFKWMKQKASLLIYPEDGQSLLFEVGSPESFPAKLWVSCQGTTKEFSIINGWQQLAIDLKQSEKPFVVNFATNAKHSAQDSRCLALMVSNLHLCSASQYSLNSRDLHIDLFKKTVTNSKPTFFTFETSAICNMHCSMCVVDEKLKKYSSERIKSSTKTDYIYDELLPFSTKLQLHATGEVLTGKDFWKALHKAQKMTKDRTLEIEIFTNGQLLTHKNINKLLESPLTDLVVSMDAATDKTYSRIRGGDFQQLCANVKNLISENNKRGKLRIALAMVLMRENIEELPLFIEKAKDLGADTVTFWPLFAVGMKMPPKVTKDGFIFYYKQQMLINYPNITQKMILRATTIANELGIRIGITPCFSKNYEQIQNTDLPYPIPFETFVELVETRKQQQPAQDKPDVQALKGCYLPWNTAFVTTEGRFAPCLLLTYLGGIDSIIGKDFQNEVWNSKIMQELRQSIIDGKPHSLCSDAQCIFVNKLY